MKGLGSYERLPSGGVVWGGIQAASPLVFWWLDAATVYALGLVLIASVYIGFAVADGAGGGLAHSQAYFGSSLLDEFGDGCRLRDVDRMAARDLDNGRTRPRRHLALCRWRDHPVFGRDEVPAWLAPPCRLSDRAAQGV